MGYISLHNHSFGSLRDAFSSPKEMAEQAARYHQSAISITDHGSVSMIPQFYQECLAAGVKPILGNEMYICSDVTLKDRTYHLIVLAKNSVGYKNLLKLDTISHENYYRRPRIDMNILKQHKEGLVVTSACMGSWWNTEQAEERTKEFRDIFGDDFYLELQANSWDDQKVYNSKIMELAEKHKVKLIITTDSHVPTREMCRYQHMWNSIGKSQAFYTTEDFYIMGEQEIISRMSKDIPVDILRAAIDNTQEIADKCNVTIEVTGDNYPKYPCDNQKEKIKELCRVGWKQKVSGKVTRELWDTYVTQFNHEMDVLDKCNYYNILLITWDYIRYARDNDILVGPARGSCAGSLVCYLMGITDVDPIEHRLVFERFVNIERITPGDLDVDFEDIHRDDIVTYIKQKYGKVFPVRTFGYLGEKGAIQKAGMALHMEPKVYMSISKGAESISDIKGYPELVEVANAFNGRLYNFSAHASAVMIFPGPVEDFCSIEKQGDTYVASYDAHVLESYNMLKCDILGLRNLSVIHDTLTLIGKKMDVYRLPHDHEVYQKLANGYTMGTFQIESKMMQGLCKDIHIDSFDDLANILALGRPGPLDSGLTQQYIDAKRTGEVPKLHPIVDKILESTFGAMIFQEDMLLIAREYAGYSVGEADVLRKTIGRKELDKIDAVVAEFIQRCDSINRPHDVSVRLGEILKACGRYLFSKNHSYAYCTISNTTAWLAKYYSREYFCSTLNSVIDDHEKSVVYLAELKRLKIPVYPPDLSIGNRKWTLESNGIRMGLEYIKGVGKNLNTEHTETFESVVESNTKTCVIPCIKAGALDYLKLSRAVMLAKFAGTQESLKRVQECQEKIEKYTGDPKKAKLLLQWQEKLKTAQEITQVTPEKYDMIAGECEVLSFSFHEIPKVKTGEVTNVFKKNDKNGREMAWVTIKTNYGDFRCTVFADGWAKVGALVRLGESYKFVVNNQGILEELQVDDKVIKVNERKYKKNF